MKEMLELADNSSKNTYGKYVQRAKNFKGKPEHNEE